MRPTVKAKLVPFLVVAVLITGIIAESEYEPASASVTRKLTSRSSSGGTFRGRLTTLRPGTVRRTSRVCQRLSTNVETWTTTSIDPEGNVTIASGTTPISKTVACAPYPGGPSTTAVWPIDTGENLEVQVPDPEINTDGKNNRWITQRVGYLWVPRNYFDGISPAVVVDGRVDPTLTANFRATEVEIHPGVGTKSSANWFSCSMRSNHLGYDHSKDHWEQEDLCAYAFFKSSKNEPGGVYTATVRVTWIGSITGLPVAETGIELKTESTIRLRVEELQTLQTCQSSSTSCRR